MDGLFYYDERGNPRRMKFAYDMTEEDITLQELYHEWEKNPTLAAKGSEEWDEWRKRASDWQFYDQAKVYVKGGDGGAGEVAFRREAHVDMGGPFGGNGGNGGDVWFEADEGDNTLARLRSRLHLMAEGGQRGGGKGKHRANADPLVIKVPLGTIIRDAESDVLIGDLSEPGQRLLVAKGGKGGRGNMAFKTAKDTAPGFAELGEKGKQRWVSLQLKLVADVGIVGVPNAGKSSLLAAVTNAKPKVADYPFTTVVPNLGVAQLPGAERQTMVLADIPGLLEGAHEGHGLGQAFLRHLERCRILLHVVDGSAEDPLYNFKSIQNELELFNPELAKKPQVVVINKMDLPHVRERWEEIRDMIKKEAGHGRVDGISAAANKNIMPILVKVKAMLDKMPPASEQRTEKTEEEMEREQALAKRMLQTNTRTKHLTHSVVKRAHNIWELNADERLHRTIEMTNFDNDEAEERFYRILQASGVRETLRAAGCRQGHTIILAGYEFEYRDDESMMGVLAKEAGYYD